MGYSDVYFGIVSSWLFASFSCDILLISIPCATLILKVHIPSDEFFYIDRALPDLVTHDSRKAVWFLHILRKEYVWFKREQKVQLSSMRSF